MCLVTSDQRFRNHPPERLADRYQVQDEIGSGASAITYRGWDERLERTVAIKILRDSHANDETFARRFRQEARSAASVSHGNVVDVYDFGQQDEWLYIVMQFIDGEDLKHLIQREAPLGGDRTRQIIGQILDGLQAIHAVGIIHRDIKPQNVLIGRDGNARVTDFGVAHLEEDSGMTTTGTTVGTAAYMAPEQAQAGRITEATDLYAVGVVLYEMMTGFLPYNAPTAMGIMLEHIQGEPVPPSQRLPGHGISQSMDGIILQAMAKRPEDRFRSARAMKQAINQSFRSEINEGQRTVVTPAYLGTAAMPRQEAFHGRPASVAPRRRMEAEPLPASHTSSDGGSGIHGTFLGLLLVLLVGVAGVAAWFAYTEWDASRPSGAVPPPPTERATEAPTTPLEPTATVAPTEPDAVIAPIEPISVPTEDPAPTNTPVPTPAPTQAPAPTATLEPTDPPVQEEDPPQIIEPMDITPIPTPSDQGRSRGNSESHRQDDKKDKKEKEKGDD